jgi:hypothetical protein
LAPTHRTPPAESLRTLGPPGASSTRFSRQTRSTHGSASRGVS